MKLFVISVTPCAKTKAKNESLVSSNNQLHNYYEIFLVFDACAKILSCFPYSMRSCYDGSHFFSHITGFFFTRCAQRCDYNQDFYNLCVVIQSSCRITQHLFE